MHLEVFLHGAEDGAEAYPNTDSLYFQNTFYHPSDIKGEFILDVRLRKIEDRYFTDYTLLLYGLTATIGRPGAHLGITYRLEGYVENCVAMYDHLKWVFDTEVCGVITDSGKTKFLKPISSFKKLPSDLEKGFVSSSDKLKKSPINVSNQGAGSTINSYHPEDINNEEIKRRVFDRKIIRISNSCPSCKQNAMQKHNQERQIKLQKEMEAKEKQNQSKIKELEEKIRHLEKDRDRIQSSKEQGDSTLQEIRKLLDRIPQHPPVGQHLLKAEGTHHRSEPYTKGLARNTHLLASPALQTALLFFCCAVSFLTLLFATSIISLP